MDFILDTVSAHHSVGPTLELLKVNGTLVIVGAPDRPIDLPSFPLIFGKPPHQINVYIIFNKLENLVTHTYQLNLRIGKYVTGKRVVKGSMIGSIKETQEMMDLCGKHNITCDIEVVSTDQINEALHRLAKNDVKYRFVIDIAGRKSSKL